MKEDSEYPEWLWSIADPPPSLFTLERKYPEDEQVNDDNFTDVGLLLLVAAVNALSKDRPCPHWHACIGAHMLASHWMSQEPPALRRCVRCVHADEAAGEATEHPGYQRPQRDQSKEVSSGGSLWMLSRASSVSKAPDMVLQGVPLFW